MPTGRKLPPARVAQVADAAPHRSPAVSAMAPAPVAVLEVVMSGIVTRAISLAARLRIARPAGRRSSGRCSPRSCAGRRTHGCWWSSSCCPTETPLTPASCSTWRYS
jgi:hypothetical protein